MMPRIWTLQKINAIHNIYTQGRNPSETIQKPASDNIKLNTKNEEGAASANAIMKQSKEISNL